MPSSSTARVLLVLAAALACGDTTPARSLASGAEPDTSFLSRWIATYRFSLGRPNAIQLTPAGDAVLFLRSGPRSFVQDLWTFDPATGGERVLLTAEQILRGGAETLTVEERARRERLRQAARGIASFQLSKDGAKILAPLSGRLFVIDRATTRARELASTAGAAEDPRFSPDGDRVACVRDGDLYVTDVASGAETRLTTRPTQEVTNGVAEFVAQEEMDRFEGYWWSPDSRWIAYEEADATGLERMNIMDPSRPEQAPQSWPYPRPGKANVKVRLGVMPRAGGPTTWVRWDQKAYPYLCHVGWPEKGPLHLLVMNREQTREALLAADPATGATRTLLLESDPAWLNLEQTAPLWLEDGSGFLWVSDRAGPRRLERHARDGRLLGVLTPASFEVRKILDADARSGFAWITASEARREGGGAVETHVYRVPLAARGLPRRVSDEPGVHDAVFSADHSRYVLTTDPASPGAPRRFQVCESAGRTVGAVVGSLRSLAESPPFTPEPDLLRVGPRGVAVVLLRPHDPFPYETVREPATAGKTAVVQQRVHHRKYPVLVSVYGGPHSQTVQNVAARYLFQQWIADHGFIVVSIDGRGTPGRGRVWERAIRGDLIGPALDDQVETLKALGARFPEMDLSRVGIYGWSFGGYFTAMALMRRPDVFKAGVAGAPVVDWRDYDTFYTERYLGLPQADSLAYRRSSVLTYAAQLERPILIQHGTADDNVYFFNSLKLIDALNRAGKRYEFTPLAGQTHSVRDPAMIRRVNEDMLEFFERELGGSGAPAPTSSAASKR